MRFHIYAKYRTQKKFRAMNLKTNEQTDNIIKATVLEESEARRFMNTEAPINAPDWMFELREVK